MNKELPRVTRGKGRAVDDKHDSYDSPSEATPSLASRVAASASGLARNITGQANSDLPASLASSLASGGKPQPSTSSSGGNTGLDSLRLNQSSSSTVKERQLRNNGLDESFRTTTIGDGTISQEFDSFMSEESYQHLHHRSSREPQERSAWAAEFGGSRIEPNSSRLYDDRHYASEGQDTWVAEHHDGTEVREMLSDPSFVAMTDVYDLEDSNKASVADLFPQSFSEEEQRAVDQMKSTLPQPPNHGPVSVKNPLNLRPNFDDDGQRDTDAFAASNTKQKWLSEWDAVLYGYTDEVWGELLPVVQEARKELQQVRSGTGDLDTKAITRLKMILGHVNEHNGMVQIFENETRWLNNHETSSDDETDLEMPDILCPWISCHERFHNTWDFRLHSSKHLEYPYPHTSCVAHFVKKADWGSHIGVAHHHLLDTRLEIVNVEV